MLTLDQINQDDIGFDLGGKNGSSDKPFFEPEKAYAVTITDVVPKQSQKGFLQVEVALQFTGTEKKAGRQWLMLPIFTNEMSQSMDPVRKKELADTFGKRLQAFLRAADPALYSVYDRLDKSTKKWRYFLADGSEISQAEMAQRKKDVAHAINQLSIKIATGEDAGLTGAALFLVTTVDKKDPSRTYTNWYGEQPSKYEFVDVAASDTDTPF